MTAAEEDGSWEEVVVRRRIWALNLRLKKSL
jgi:hypothetical protein